MSELKFGFCRGGLWQMARAEVGVMFTGEIKKKRLQKGQYLALADGKGRNGFDISRHDTFFFVLEAKNPRCWHLFCLVATPFKKGSLLDEQYCFFANFGHFKGSDWACLDSATRFFEALLMLKL